MNRFIDDAIERAGLLPVLVANRAGDMAAVREADLRSADLLALGAVADAIRAEDVGALVRVHAPDRHDRATTWVDVPGGSDLDLLRAVAIARITSARGARVGVDWSRCGLELAQVALGFGATDLRGPITRKSGLPIFEGEDQRVKGEGRVALSALKRREIAALVRHAGREIAFLDDAHEGDARRGARAEEVAGA